MAADGAFGRVIWDEKFVIDDATEGAATCEDGQHLPFLAVVSSLISKTAQDFLLQGKKSGFHIYPGGVMAV